ncbi:MAG TPA: hypothetical protein VI072_11075 [Polyangiaceae bacterium]|jgi:hypothetical protein
MNKDMLTPIDDAALESVSGGSVGDLLTGLIGSVGNIVSDVVELGAGAIDATLRAAGGIISGLGKLISGLGK